MRKIVVSILSLTIVGLVFASEKPLHNLDKHNVAIQGYDPVAFFTDNKPVKGDAAFQSTYSGATYYFASADHKALFEKEPSKYEPAFGGFCAYGVSRNKLAEIDPEAFQIVDGKLLLQYSKGVRNEFNKDTQGNLAKAKTNWPGLVEKKKD
jgi:YHS domain-containing protein